MDSPRVVVVGTCASGKTTLAAALRNEGVDATVCAQEHSDVATLWSHSEPDLLVLIEIDLATIRARRSPTWPRAIYEAQLRRLANARAAADIIIDSRVTTVAQSVAMVLQEIERVKAGRPPE